MVRMVTNLEEESEYVMLFIKPVQRNFPARVLPLRKSPLETVSWGRFLAGSLGKSPLSMPSGELTRALTAARWEERSYLVA